LAFHAVRPAKNIPAKKSYAMCGKGQQGKMGTKSCRTPGGENAPDQVSYAGDGGKKGGSGQKAPQSWGSNASK